jgi:YidC/Oxa1 family membrane protein insertase
VNLWDTIIIQPFANILLLIYSFLGHNFAIAIVIFTVLIRLITYPLTIQQQRSAKAMQQLQPQLQALQKKYAKDKEKLTQEQMALYKEAGVNPLGGCLPLLLQFPIFIGLYQVILLVMAVNPLQMLNLSKQIYSFLPGLAALLPLNPRFLWLDMGRPDLFYILPILVVITTYWQQKVMTPPSADPQSQAMNKQMGLMMPLMFGYFVLVSPSGLGLYWLISNLIGVAQYWMVGKPEIKTTAMTTSGVPAKPAAKQPASTKPAVSTKKKSPAKN